MTARKKTIKAGTTRKGGRPKDGRTIKVPAKFKGHEPHVEFHPGPRGSSPEDTLPAPSDDAAKHKFPPPKKNPVYRDTWMKYIESLINRDNFHTGHLESLKILCDLYVEYYDLEKWIKEHGRSYCSVGRQGEVWKLYPEVGLQKNVNSQIKEYLKLLGLVPKKDHGTESGGEGKAWD